MKAMAITKCVEIDAGKGRPTIPGLSFTREPLMEMAFDIPAPGPRELLVKVAACGVCHTEIDEIEGRLPPPVLPVIPGHEVVGRIVEAGPGVTRFAAGDRVGIAWIHSCCDACRFCEKGLENLCDGFEATGLHAHGGYAEYTTVREDFAYPVPDAFSDEAAAPLLCAGVVGYRALRLTEIEPGMTLGLYGFGASAHIVIQIAVHLGCKVFVFSRPGAKHHGDMAEKLGAAWTGATNETPPEKLDRAIDFTPVGEPVKAAMEALEKGGRLVINAIRKRGPIPELDYARHVWHEKEIKSTANVTRRDAEEFLKVAADVNIRPQVTVFGLSEANRALCSVKAGDVNGAAVLVP